MRQSEGTAVKRLELLDKLYYPPQNVFVSDTAI